LILAALVAAERSGTLGKHIYWIIGGLVLLYFITQNKPAATPAA
jgi:hypothetical protein